ncbi:SWI6 [Candida pseudojiufengensis]|uniref:SWI6 n=1 Tax=Candida pseudojiufengensis TaxID=497109 RepID=UPI00222536D7|nr:SWI6 [Candida pseudojiufengensis]KAI5963556.1 SWI6 [Candida pseudojiufengensis]
MESPINIGDLTTNSIQQKLTNTHINSVYSTNVTSAIYSRMKIIQLTIKFGENVNNNNNNKDIENTNINELNILRRVQDSFINISQLLQILVQLNLLSSSQIESFIKNEILTNPEYHGRNLNSKNNSQILDYRNNDNKNLRGIWVSYDKAVNIALKFDIYELTKDLYLVDVHDFEKLPKYKKRSLDDDNDDSFIDHIGSPSKKQKLENNTTKSNNESSQNKQTTIPKNSKIIVDKYVKQNNKYPFTLSPKVIDDSQLDLTNDIKIVLGEIFKKDDKLEDEVSIDVVKKEFEPILQKYSKSDHQDIPLDQKGQTALHFASTLASLNLVSSFIQLGLSSPVCGNDFGESPLISCIQVTNSMEKGNFNDILTNWLYPNIWLFDKSGKSILHHLALQSDKNESFKFYLIKILEYILLSNDKKLIEFKTNIINSKDDEGNTALHIAIEKENKWLIKILLELGADVKITNKHNIKCEDFEILNDLEKDEFDDHIFHLIQTSYEFLNERIETVGIDNITEAEELKESVEPNLPNSFEDNSNEPDSSSKIFQSIQHLLSDTNHQYANILNSKRQQIKTLDQALHDATITAANNRFQSKKLKENLINLDNLKLQVVNVTDKLLLLKQEYNNNNDKDTNEEEQEKFDENQQYYADAPYIIEPIYKKITNNESLDDLKNDTDLMKSLPPINSLKAKINAYKQINENLENELQSLIDYSELTSKFKNVVSICTNVGIGEVDELLDGLLEAVEGQQ